MKKSMWLVCLGFFLPLGAESILSSQGFGQPIGIMDVRAWGMGATTLAMPDPYRITPTNPALLMTVNTTRLTLHMRIEDIQTQDLESAIHDRYTGFTGFAFATPLGKGFHLGFGIHPLTRIRFHLALKGMLEEISYTRSLIAKGGINSAWMALAWRPLTILAIGWEGSAVFGKITERWEVQFPTQSGFSSTQDRLITHMRGFGTRAGLYIKPLSWASFGVVWFSDMQLDSEVNLAHLFDRRSEWTREDRYPGSWGMGASIGKGLWTLGMDYLQTDWHRLSIGNHPWNRAQQERRISWGIEKRASPDPLSPYRKRIPLRFGGQLGPHYSLDANGHRIQTWWVTAGFGLPLYQNTSHIDVAFGIGRCGNREENGIEETRFKIMLALTGGEIWFIRRY